MLPLRERRMGTQNLVVSDTGWVLSVESIRSKFYE